MADGDQGEKGQSPNNHEGEPIVHPFPSLAAGLLSPTLHPHLSTSVLFLTGLPVTMNQDAPITAA